MRRLNGFLAVMLVLGMTGRHAAARAEGGEGSAVESASAQILVECNVIEMPTRIAHEMLGGSEEIVAGRTLTRKQLQELLRGDDVALLSAPRLVTVADRSAQIRVGDERTFTTGTMETDSGAWQPREETFEFGFVMTILARLVPGAPDQVRADVEVQLSELVDVQKKVSSAREGAEGIELEVPVISRRDVVASVTAPVGVPTIIGGLERETDGESVTTYIVLTLDTISAAADLVVRLKEMKIDSFNVTEMPLPEIVNYLAKAARAADPTGRGVNFVLHGSAAGGPVLTLALESVSIYDVLRMISRTTGVEVEYEAGAVLLRVPEN